MLLINEIKISLTFELSLASGIVDLIDIVCRPNERSIIIEQIEWEITFLRASNLIPKANDIASLQFLQHLPHGLCKGFPKSGMFGRRLRVRIVLIVIRIIRGFCPQPVIASEIRNERLSDFGRKVRISSYFQVRGFKFDWVDLYFFRRFFSKVIRPAQAYIQVKILWHFQIDQPKRIVWCLNDFCPIFIAKSQTQGNILFRTKYIFVDPSIVAQWLLLSPQT